jgi:V8-like Glu-specific endopeptidase
MVSILDSFPYPWHEPAAQQLHVTLSQLHPTSQAATLVAQKSGIDVSMIFAQQAPILVWREILDAAAAGGLTRQLVQGVRDLLNQNSPLRPHLEDLLADKPVPTEGEPRGADGAPSFFANNDDVSEPEALLYHDDLTIQIGRLPGLIVTLQRLAGLAPAVCKLVVEVNGVEQCGTGFRIGPDLLLTNWHVLHNKDNGIRATAVTAEFGYEDDGGGGALAATVIPCEVESIVTSKADDWAVIRARQPLMDAWPVVKLSESVPPSLNAAAYIIQHPGGQRKRVGFVRNQVSFFDNRVVHYLTDTQTGSSGSPVFNGQGKLIALHHAGGRPQEVVGRAPMRKNEGIRISRIVEGLESQNFPTP